MNFRNVQPLELLRQILFGVACIAIVCGTVGCGKDPKPSGDADAATAQNTLVIARASDSSTLDPALGTVVNDTTINYLTYERLVREEVKDGAPTGRVVGELAESWSSDPTGMIWTFRLRPDHKFDDGSPVDAKAVAFSITRAGAVNPGLAQDMGWLKKSEVVDEHTIRMTLVQPLSIFLHFMAHPAGAVINPAAVAQHQVADDQAAGWLSKNTAGSGPYRLKRWDRDQSIQLERNPGYPVAPARFAQIDLRVIKDETSRRAQFEKGGIDIYEGLSAQSLPSLSGMQGVRILSLPAPRTVNLLFNFKNKALAELPVRRAIAASLDRKQLVEQIFGKQAVAMDNLLPPQMPGARVSGQSGGRDLTQAKSLLAAAGHDAQHPLKVELVYLPGDASIDALVVAMQSQMADANIQLTLRGLAPATMQDALAGGRYDMALQRSVIPFPDLFMALVPPFHSSEESSPGGNVMRYRNHKVDELLDRATVETDPAKQATYYQTAEALISADIPMVAIAATNVLLAVRSDLEGLNYSGWLPGMYNASQMTRSSTAK